MGFVGLQVVGISYSGKVWSRMAAGKTADG
jgi:hypothetical protein